MKAVVGVSLGLLALSGVARSDVGSPTDGGVSEAGPEPTPEPAPEAPDASMQVCLCALHVAASEPQPVPLAPALDEAVVRARVLAGLSPELRARLSPPPAR